MPAKRADHLSVLFDAHADRLYRLARRLASNSEDALDLVQETFLRAARAPDSIPWGLRHEEAWLVRVLVNIRRDQWRKERVRKLHEASLGHLEVRPGDSERTVLIRTTVWRALDDLSPRRRTIVVMRELEGLSIADIAALLGITAITVRWHLSRGRRELARILRLQLGEHDEQSQRSVGGRGPAPVRNSAP
jgi:RNA polymerase sigma-70 factor (ECF subfamily)